MLKCVAHFYTLLILYVEMTRLLYDKRCIHATYVDTIEICHYALLYAMNTFKI
jgi:hypothetical protein